MQSQLIIFALWIIFCYSLDVTDQGNYRDRMVSVGVTLDNIITTYAGSGSFAFSGDGGAATSAAINSPIGVSLDSSGNSNSYAV